MMSGLAGVALLFPMMVLGVAALRRWTWLGSLETFAYGSVLGVVASSLVLVPLASLLGWSPRLVAITGLIVGLLGAALLRTPRSVGEREPRTVISFGVVVVIALFLVRWAFLAWSSLAIDARGLWAGHIHVWGDWSQHLGDVTSFAYGDNFPPTHPRLAGHPLSYHYLTSVTVAAMVALGMTPIAALETHTFVFLSLTTLAIFAFARRLTHDSPAAALALTLFLVGGGLGWVATLRDAMASGDPWGTFWADPWDRVAQREGNFRWLNVTFAYLLPQRAVLYGLPLGLLALTLLFEGAREGRTRPFLVAGVAVGLLPLAHLGTMLALALITPFLVLAFPRRGWAWFFGVWAALAIPTFLAQQGGSGGALSHIRLDPGWVADSDPWWLFWLKNLGAFAPLLIGALADREVIPPPGRRFLLTFMPVFVIANLVAFQPWDWDNTKVLLYWYLAGCVLVAAALTRAWRHGGPWSRIAIFLTLGTLLLSGLFAHLEQALGRDRYLILTSQELRVAEAVRVSTPPHALFLVGLQHNHPVTMLSGRKVVLGYRGWMWSQGFPYQSREADVRSMYALDPRGQAALARDRVDYVVIGPWEREQLGANQAAFHARYTQVVDLPPYAVYDLKKPLPPSATPDSTSAPRTRPS